MDSDKITYKDFEKAAKDLWEATYTMESNYTIVMSPELIAALDETSTIINAIETGIGTASMWYGAWSGTAYVDENQKKALGLTTPKRDLDKFDYLLEEAK